MTNHRLFKKVIAVLCMVSMLCFSQLSQEMVFAKDVYALVVLNTYQKTVNIGDEFYLIAASTDGRKIRFSSSDSKVASVNTYGLVTAKKAGTAKITAKTVNGEASCRITVRQTAIELGTRQIFMENGTTVKLTAHVSTGHKPSFKSQRKSVATVDENGWITAVKPGETTITVSADRTSATCKVTVKKPTVSLSRSSATLYRKGELKLSVSSTSKSTPRWKTNKSSVATVDSSGKVTAVKHGTAVITVTVDGVKKSCVITVKQPEITLERTDMTLSPGQKKQVKVKVSSGNTPVFSSSNTNVATVDANGVVYAAGRGKASIYVSEDGVKVKLTVTVK